jgi:pimeloyl-ACP methyl ester carboxylesterase
MKLLLLAGLLVLPFQDQEPEPALPKGSRLFRIQAEDKVPITGEIRRASPDPTTPFLLLLHDSHSSRGEYHELMPRLLSLGFNAMAIDLRVGGKCKQVKNVTARYAKGIATLKRSDALLDIEAALLHARANEAHGKLFVWGSAYSASLALVAAERHPDLVDGVIAFAPGEYFQDDGQPENWVRDTAARVRCPVFVASEAGSEADWKPIFEALPAELRESFVPAKGGRHGSSSLWAEVPESEEYWKALIAFLDRHVPRAPAAPDDVPGGEPAQEPPSDG